MKAGFFASTLLLFAVARAQDVASVLSATGAGNGFVLHVGATDGSLEAGLAQSGAFLVEGVATDHSEVLKARAFIAEKGLLPLANCRLVSSFKKLPHADHLVNLLIADLERLGIEAPSDEEVLRLLAYGGKAYVKKGGAWTVVANPMPRNVDDWPYLFHDARRRNISRDEVAGPWSGLKWIGGPKTLGQSVSLRVEGGVVYTIRGFRSDNTISGPKGVHLIARDAFSGLLLWYKQMVYAPTKRGATKTGSVFLVANEGLIYTYMGGEGSHLSALEGRSGEQVRTFDKTATIQYTLNSRSQPVMADPDAISQSVLMFLGADSLVQTFKNHMWLLNKKTGEVMWHHEEPDTANWIYQAVLGSDGRIYATTTLNKDSSTFKDNSAGHMSLLKDLVCFDKGGNEVWRNTTDMKGFMLSYLGGPAEGIIPMILHSREIDCSFDDLHMFAFNMADGTKKWMAKCKFINWTSNTMMVHRGKLIVGQGGSFLVYSIETGAYEGEHKFEQAPGCMSLSFSEDKIFQGPRVASMPSALDLGGQRQILPAECPVAFRGNCGEITSPAYGQMYCPGTVCGCSWYLPGDLAVYQAEPVVPIPDDRRLVDDEQQLIAGITSSSRTTKYAFKGSGPVVQDWAMAVDYLKGSKSTRFGFSSATTIPPWNFRESATVTSGPYTITTRIHLNTIEVNKNGSVLWNYFTQGRVSVEPLVHNDLLLFGCHDGWVYALNLDDGALVWRYMAAPMERVMVAYGQAESAWPLYGVLLQSDKLFFMAGRSSGVDSGMVAGALNATTGEQLWRVRIKQENSAARENFMNVPLQLSGEKLTYAGPAISTTNPTSIIIGGNTAVDVRTPRNESYDIQSEISLALTSGKNVKVRVFDVSGKVIYTRSGKPSVGTRAYVDRLSNGFYVYALWVDGKVISRRSIMVVKP